MPGRENPGHPDPRRRRPPPWHGGSLGTGRCGAPPRTGFDALAAAPAPRPAADLDFRVRGLVALRPGGAGRGGPDARPAGHGASRAWSAWPLVEPETGARPELDRGGEPGRAGRVRCRAWPPPRRPFLDLRRPLGALRHGVQPGRRFRPAGSWRRGAAGRRPQLTPAAGGEGHSSSRPPAAAGPAADRRSCADEPGLAGDARLPPGGRERSRRRSRPPGPWIGAHWASQVGAARKTAGAVPWGGPEAFVRQTRFAAMAGDCTSGRKGLAGYRRGAARVSGGSLILMRRHAGPTPAPTSPSDCCSSARTGSALGPCPPAAWRSPRPFCRPWGIGVRAVRAPVPWPRCRRLRPFRLSPPFVPGALPDRRVPGGVADESPGTATLDRRRCRPPVRERGIRAIVLRRQSPVTPG